jgi:phenylalanyl-tRNA synthetase alpha chain
LYSVPKLDDWSPHTLDRAVADLLAGCEAESQSVHTDAELKNFRDRWLARKNGVLTQVNELWLKAAPKEAKRDVGQRVNRLNARVTEIVESAKSKSVSAPLAGALDITLPGTARPLGAENPVIRTMNDIVAVFKRMGYSVGEGPEIETDYYNFESLNFPPNHPARDTQDTIFLAGQDAKPQRERLLLRTHTSPVQIRTMEKQRPPVRIVIPGRVHRNDEADATHSPVFHQVEGLCVDKGITFCDLKGTLDHAMKAFFGTRTKTRLQPSYFPFTEPSAEVAVTCFKCGGSGRLASGDSCRLCKSSGWVELLGCGMVDPAVYGFVGYDPREVSGFAFGMGVERIAMAMYDIDDIELLYSGDVRFLEQFA